MPSEMFEFAARQVSAGEEFICACGEAERVPNSASAIAKAAIRVLGQIEIDVRPCRLAHGFKAG